MPRRALLGIGALVLVLHVLALQGVGFSLDAGQTTKGKVFAWRGVLLDNPLLEPVRAPAKAGQSSPPDVKQATSGRAAPAAQPVASVQAQKTVAVPVKPASQTGDSLLRLDTQGASLAQLAAPADNQSVSDSAASPVVLAKSEPANSELTKPDSQAATTTDTSANAPAFAPSFGKLGTAAEPMIEFIAPKSTRLKYDVVIGRDRLTLNAKAELLWLHDGKNYDARLEISNFLLGSRIRTSTGSLSAEGLEPVRFADRNRTEVAAHFVKNRKIVSFSANTPDTDLVPGMQDQLSVFVQMGGLMLAAPNKYPAGTTLIFETIGPRAPESWELLVDGEETLSLPGGKIQALKLSRLPRQPFEQRAEVWLAQEMGFLPVRIKITDSSGDYVDQLWRSTETP